MGYDITVCVVDIQRWQEEYLSVLGQGTAHPFIASEIKFLNTLYDSDNYDIEYNITNKKDFCGIDKVMASASSDYRHFSINRRCCGKHGMFYEEGYPTKLEEDDYNEVWFWEDLIALLLPGVLRHYTTHLAEVCYCKYYVLDSDNPVVKGLLHNLLYEHSLMDEENNEYGIAGWLTAEQVEQLYSLQDELYRDDTDTYNIFCAVLAKAKELGKGLMAINGIRFNAEIEGDPTRDYPYRYRLYETFYTGKYNDAKINLRLIELLNVL